MKTIGLIAVSVALVGAPAAAGLDRAQTKALVRIAVKLSGLSERAPVRIVAERPARFRQRRVALLDRAYPRSAQSYYETVYRALGLEGPLRQTLLALQDERGLYDPATRTGYVQAGAGERTAALREAVHTLQDQHFQLARIGRLHSADAKIAARAAVEGYASLVTEGLPRARPAAPRGSRLRRFLALERGFVDSAGLRFEADLRYVGGTKAAIDSLRRFPATSEQVFHLDKYLQREPATKIVLPARTAVLVLARQGSFGELDVRALLAVFGVPRVDQMGTGWGGGRTARYVGARGDLVAVALDWDTQLDATQWGAAVETYVDKAFGAGGALAACTVTTCWQLGSRAIAFARFRTRTALVLGADLARAEALARAIAGRP